MLRRISRNGEREWLWMLGKQALGNRVDPGVSCWVLGYDVAQREGHMVCWLIYGEERGPESDSGIHLVVSL